METIDRDSSASVREYEDLINQYIQPYVNYSKQLASQDKAVADQVFNYLFILYYIILYNIESVKRYIYYMYYILWNPLRAQRC